MFKKRMTTSQKMGEYESHCWYEDQVSFMQDLESPRPIPHHPYATYPNCKAELDQLQYNMAQDHFLQLPQLESPKVTQSPPTSLVHYGYASNGSTLQLSSLTQEEIQVQNLHHQTLHSLDQVTDWRVLDKFVASQLSHDQDHGSKETSYSQEHTSTSTSSGQINLWK